MLSYLQFEKAISYYYAVPDGGLIRVLTTSTVFINTSQTVAIRAQIIGGPNRVVTGIFLRSSTGVQRKVAATGDIEPGTGRKLTAVNMSGLLPRPLNDAGQVVFSASLEGVATSPAGLFVGTTDAAPLKVALVGDGSPDDGTFANFPSLGSVSINQAGQVAFLANTQVGATQRLGVYIGTPGSNPAEVVEAGDPGPYGTSFSGFGFPAFNTEGEVAFSATLNGARRGGFFLGSASGALTVLALDGDAAPEGGFFSIASALPDITMNDSHDIVFRAELTGGSSNSGYFMRRGATGNLHAIVLQGQLAPGTTGTFGRIATSLNNYLAESFRLDQTGELTFQGTFTEGGDPLAGIWHVNTDDSIEKVIVRGVIAPQFGGGATVVSNIGNAWNSGGRFPLWVRVSGGTFIDSVFLFVPLSLTPTPVGSNVDIDPKDSTTGSTPVSITFDSVTQAGNTSLTTSASGPAIPDAFSLGEPAVFYNVETTAAFTGSITVCVDSSGVTFAGDSVLRLLHFEGGIWTDITTSRNGNIICGQVASLSPFVVARLNPTLRVAMMPNILWPPDNKLARVTAYILVDNTLDPNPRVELVSISSNEPLEPNDIQGAMPGTDCRSFQLRATRQGGGNGRTYFITYRATTSSGYSLLETAQVVVPHDQGKR